MKLKYDVVINLEKWEAREQIKCVDSNGASLGL